MISVGCRFDGGDIAFVDGDGGPWQRCFGPGGSAVGAPTFEVDDDTGAVKISLRLRRREGVKKGGWFFFRAQGLGFEDLRIKIDLGLPAPSNGAVPAPGDPLHQWNGWNAVASHDKVNWFRVNTSLEGGSVVIEHTPLADSVYYAYFEPYTYERHLNLLGQIQGSGLCKIESVAATPMGRDVNLLVVGNEVESDLRIWVVARENVADASASWVMEGFLNKLVDSFDASSRALFTGATLYVVPMANPDGASLGDQDGSEASVIDLEGLWGEGEFDDDATDGRPFKHESCEISAIMSEMAMRGCDLLVDVSSGPEVGKVMLASAKRDVLEKWAKLFSINVGDASSEDPREDAGLDPSGMGFVPEGSLERTATRELGCPAIRVLVPVGDNEELPDVDYGWSGQRSWRLGEDLVDFLRSLLMLGDIEREE